MRRRYVVGNWKMNGLAADIAHAREIAAEAVAMPIIDVALCPPATLIASVCAAVPTLAVGGQDCHAQDKGAFTGSVSAAMIADAGARLCIVGHSERRQGVGESDAMVSDKAMAALTAGLAVIICVGEPLAVREAGEAESYVLAQITGSVCDAALVQPERVAIAYEPIWAIGTGVTATPDDIAAMHSMIRTALRNRRAAAADAVRLLYGGSVTAENAAAIFACADVDGALVGGASLTAAKFVPIMAAANG
jgi:triosephosphate isomerase (TIM)